MELAGALKAGKYGFDLVKGIRETLRRDDVDPREISNRLMEIQELLLEMQSALGDAQEENRRLKAQLAEDDLLAKLSDQLAFQESVYWKKREDASLEPEPYCPKCWEKDQKLIHLNPGATRGFYACGIDNTSYKCNSRL